MRTAITTPSRVPSPDGTVYLVLDDFAEFGRAYRETDPTRADRQSIVADLLSGQYERPLRIVAFNLAQGWARDVTVEIAQEAWLQSGPRDRPSWLRDLQEPAP